MIEYTQEEREELKDHFWKRKKVDYDKFTYVTIKGNEYQVSWLNLAKLINGKMPTEEAHIYSDSYGVIFDMLFMIPLEKVPLYINTIPEIAAWRLRIGK